MHESASTTARVHASGVLGLRTNGGTCTGREAQFLALAARGQVVTASRSEDGPVWDWLGVAVGGERGGGCSAPAGDFLVADTRLWNYFLSVVGEGRESSRLSVGPTDQGKMPV